MKPTTITHICDAAEKLAKYAGVTLFITMIVVVFYEVVMRYLFNSPTVWTEALARNAMVWLVMLGLARGVRHMDNIRVDFIIDLMPSRIKWIAAWIRFFAVIAFAIVMVWFGLELAIDNRNNISAGFEIAKMWIYLAVPVSGILILLFTAELIVKGERGFF